MDDDLFTYEVDAANIPCDSRMDNDLEHEANDDMGYDPSDIYWIRGDDEVELTDEEFSDDMDDVTEVFKIDTNLFNFETPMRKAFKEFNYLLQIDPDLRTLGDSRPMKITRMTGSMNGTRTYHGLRVVRGLEDSELGDEALRNKAMMEGFIYEGDDESRYEQKRRWNIYTNHDDSYNIYHEDNEREELCEIHELPVCKIRRYMMIKYSFNNDEEYVAIKEDEYDDLTIIREEAFRAYQEIFWIMDEGWMVTRAE
ncbi:hypothetical protein Tco_0556479 [Tanacetum coccineum]